MQCPRKHCIQIMTKFINFHQTLWLFDQFCLVHGATGLILSKNHRFVSIFGALFCTIFLSFSGYFYAKYMYHFSLMFDEDPFGIFIRLTDGFLWICITFSTNYLNVVLKSKFKSTFEELMKVSDANLSENVKTFLNFIVILVPFYAYFVIPFIKRKFNFQTIEQWNILWVCCYEFCAIIYQQIFCIMIVYQVKRNFETMKYYRSLNDFNVNLKAFKTILRYFQEIFMLVVFYYSLGLANSIFLMFVEGDVKSAVFSYMIWHFPIVPILVFIWVCHLTAEQVRF